MIDKLNILFTKKQLSKLILIFLASLFAILFEVIGIGSIPVFAMLIIDTKSFINNVSPYISPNFLIEIDSKILSIVAACLLVSLFVFKNLYLFLLLFFQGKLLKELRSSTTNKLFQHYISMPYIVHLNRNSSLLIRSMTNDIGMTFVSVLAYIMLIRESLLLVVLFIFLVVVDPIISFFSLLLLGVPVLLFYYFHRKKLKSKGKILQTLLSDEIKTVSQSLGSIKETKLLNKEYYFLSYFNKLIQNKENLIFFHYMVTSSPRLFLESISLFSIAIISTFLIFSERSSESILPLISLYAVSAVRFIPALNVITSSLTTIRFRQPSFDLLVKEIKNLGSNPAILKKDIYTQKDKKDFKLNDSILMKDISFDYDEGGRRTLKNINLQIKQGTSVGIIGKSGSGKSTLVDIILGLLEPQKGGVYFDNKNINNELSLWQKQIGYVPQDIYLLDDSIKNNITFGLKEDEIDEKLLLQILKVSQLKDFVDTLPDAINTFVGDRGVKLSGGERQRIGIARALYNLPKIMVFDEATSSLDIENENKILDEIYENRDDKTLIIISHRNNTVKYCDLIYVLEDGKLIDQGSFKEIFNKYGYLKEMNIK
jgi:ABC-type multidrug transport system fused ATPase/permease subunit